MTGRVASIYLQPAQRTPPQPVSEAKAIVGYGLEGDVHGKKRADDRRQVLILDAGTLRHFGLRPGDLREQIAVDFPALERLPAGTQVRIGQVTFALSGPCEPCTHIGMVLEVDDRLAFQQDLQGCRGQLARVVAVDGDGMIRVGDPVTAVSVAASAG